MLALVVFGGVYYAANRIADLETANAVLESRVVGLQALNTAQAQIVESQERVTTHERTIVKEIQVLDPTNACASSAPIGLVLDDVRLREFDGKPRAE